MVGDRKGDRDRVICGRFARTSPHFTIMHLFVRRNHFIVSLHFEVTSRVATITELKIHNVRGQGMQHN